MRRKKLRERKQALWELLGGVGQPTVMQDACLTGLVLFHRHAVRRKLTFTTLNYNRFCRGKHPARDTVINNLGRWPIVKTALERM